MTIYAKVIDTFVDINKNQGCGKKICMYRFQLIYSCWILKKTNLKGLVLMVERSVTFFCSRDGDVTNTVTQGFTLQIMNGCYAYHWWTVIMSINPFNTIIRDALFLHDCDIEQVTCKCHTHLWLPLSHFKTSNRSQQYYFNPGKSLQLCRPRSSLRVIHRCQSTVRLCHCV